MKIHRKAVSAPSNSSSSRIYSWKGRISERWYLCSSARRHIHKRSCRACMLKGVCLKRADSRNVESNLNQSIGSFGARAHQRGKSGIVHLTSIIAIKTPMSFSSGSHRIPEVTHIAKILHRQTGRTIVERRATHQYRSFHYFLIYEKLPKPAHVVRLGHLALRYARDIDSKLGNLQVISSMPGLSLRSAPAPPTNTLSVWLWHWKGKAGLRVACFTVADVKWPSSTALSRDVWYSCFRVLASPSLVSASVSWLLMRSSAPTRNGRPA
jgi:hypothetical protein